MCFMGTCQTDCIMVTPLFGAFYHFSLESFPRVIETDAHTEPADITDACLSGS